MTLYKSGEQVQDRVPIYVVKIGGSLLLRPGLAPAIEHWLLKQPAGHWILIAGGGGLADVIRAADDVHQLGQSISHQLAIETMRVTARLLAALVPDARLVDSFGQLRKQLTATGRTVFDVGPFMREEEPLLEGTRLPEHWDVTSDSIAARLAIALPAEELVLAKSVLPEQGRASLSGMAAANYVDRFFPQLGTGISRLRLVDLFTEQEQMVVL